jgi:hypothetical protein
MGNWRNQKIGNCGGEGNNTANGAKSFKNSKKHCKIVGWGMVIK